MVNGELHRTDSTRQEQDTKLPKQQGSEKSKTIILTLVLSFFLIGGAGTLGYYYLFGAKSASDVNLPTTEEVEAAEKSSGVEIFKPTIEVPKTEIQRRLNVMHEYWNGRLGYDQWTSYKVGTHTSELKRIENNIREKILPYVGGPLQTDIENAIGKIERSIETKSVEPLKGVHRIFHDLDITLNDYSDASDFWEVTETYKWYQKNAVQ
ncbi:hypothetical protein AWM68_14270 [Fictibacillus phosphorivorans]|uniref:Uncharacterized protein n=1 Tax=Fictibacillus phosphorivorans TaxID=1221500 RepID=A0A163PWW8_9BACL|nr:hypothetical protein [Fictibacillus phosphorivorans]KZE64258.1 hypothetical protein AWM68_14270 [Fictibacillus phosphorivorans]